MQYFALVGEASRFTGVRHQSIDISEASVSSPLLDSRLIATGALEKNMCTRVDNAQSNRTEEKGKKLLSSEGNHRASQSTNEHHDS